MSADPDGCPHANVALTNRLSGATLYVHSYCLDCDTDLGEQENEIDD